MAIKSARYDSLDAGLDSLPERGLNQNQFGEDLREYLIDEYLVGKMDSTQVSKISYMHQKNGGTGCDELGRSDSSKK